MTAPTQEHARFSVENLAIPACPPKTLREQQGLSISDMADRTGMDRAMISRLENGHIGNPTLMTVSRYARALDPRAASIFR